LNQSPYSNGVFQVRRSLVTPLGFGEDSRRTEQIVPY
jgi:hypothetical protein